MSGTVEITSDRQLLLIRFPYREDLVDAIRTIPGRRWDKGGKTWRVPVEHVEMVVTTFLGHGFSMAPEVTGLLAGTDAMPEKVARPKTRSAGEAPTGSPEAAIATDSENESLTISQLNERVRGVLLEAFPGQIWVVGELLDYDKNKHRAHIFFTLAEKRGDDAQPAARVSAVLFERAAKRIAPKLQGTADGLTLQDGIEIRARVRVDFYPQNGRYQLIVEDIDPAFTLGQMARTREQILAELRTRGLERRNLELPLPLPALRVGVLTSDESDAWTDFRKQLESSGIGFDVTCYGIRVQGEQLRATMLAGLRWFAARADDYDVVCVLRGGGSRSDLSWFDDLQVATAVAQHPLKILCGIGHQRDQSVLDAITHSEKTPTAVGAFLVEHVHQASRALQDRTRALLATIADRMTSEHRGLGERARRLRESVRGRLGRESAGLTEAARRHERAANSRVHAETQRLGRAARDLGAGALRTIERQQRDLEHRNAKVRLLDPVQVLQRGYTITRDATGKIVKSATLVRAGRPLDVTFRDGTVRTTPDHDLEAPG